MKCYNKGPLTQADKELIIKEAEKKHGPLSEMEKLELLRAAERERLVCHPTKEDEGFIKKLLLGLALIGALALIYYLYKHSMTSHEPITAPTAQHYEEVKKPVEEATLKTAPVHEEVKKEETKPA